MTRVFLNTLKSKKQLRNLSHQKIIHAGFGDDKERFFEISFETESGNMQDLTISFESRTPKIYVSDPYTKDNC